MEPNVSSLIWPACGGVEPWVLPQQAKLSYEIAMARDMARDREDDGFKPECADGELSDDDSSGSEAPTILQSSLPRPGGSCSFSVSLLPRCGMLFAPAWLCITLGRLCHLDSCAVWNSKWRDRGNMRAGMTREWLLRAGPGFRHEAAALPFELQVLETAIGDVCALCSQLVKELEANSIPALDALTKHVRSIRYHGRITDLPRIAEHAGPWGCQCAQLVDATVPALM